MGMQNVDDEASNEAVLIVSAVRLVMFGVARVSRVSCCESLLQTTLVWRKLRSVEF